MTQPPLNVPLVQPPLPGMPSPAAPTQRSWFRRNLACIVPLGCLAMALVIGALVLAAVWVGFGKLKEMPPYRDALAAARASAQVNEALGSPIEPGIMVQFNVQWNGASGSAEMSIPLRGPKGRGTLYVSATRSLGEWSFLRLEVEVHGRAERIDLLKRNVI